MQGAVVNFLSWSKIFKSKQIQIADFGGAIPLKMEGLQAPWTIIDSAKIADFYNRPTLVPVHFVLAPHW